MADRRAIVIGGGIGGLSAALRLRQIGFEVSVFEAQKGLSEVDTGLSLWAFAVRRLVELGMADQVAKIGAPIERVVHRDPHGVTLGEVDIRGLNDRVGCLSYEVHRSKLQELLADRLGAESIRFGRRCVSVRPQGPAAEARFEDGETEAADVLVGADGVHSIVRMPRARVPAHEIVAHAGYPKEPGRSHEAEVRSYGRGIPTGRENAARDAHLTAAELDPGANSSAP